MILLFINLFFFLHSLVAEGGEGIGLNEKKNVELTIAMKKKYHEPSDEDIKPSGIGQQSTQHSKKSSISIVEERRKKYKKLQKVTVDKKGKRQREEDTIQRLLDFKSKLSEANQVRHY